jgi:SAM-dependent methyltransferase
MQLTKQVAWNAETSFVVDGLEFYGDLNSYTERTTPDRVVILKNSSLLRQYLDFLAPHPIENLLELGIWQGGSPLFYGLATDVKRVVALDIVSNDPAPDLSGQDPILAFAYKNPAIDEIIFAHNLAEKVKLHFGVSQADPAAVKAIMDSDFAGQKLDLVIDDASHHYDLSRKSFEIIFPRLREGGLYIIEDWQWAHMNDARYQSGEVFGSQPALTNFIFELLVAYGSHPDLFWNIVVRDWFVAVQKGSKALPEDFSLDEMLRMRGKKLSLI